MWKRILLLVCLSGCCLAGPLHGVKRNVPIAPREDDVDVERPAPEPLAPEYPEIPTTLTLPSNASSIRADITDSFSCDDKVYGYYADVENDCQIFHVCLPVTYADGKENTFRWSFICPEETVFSQESFTCMRREDIAFSCEDSVNYYELNRNFGMAEVQTAQSNNAEANEEQAATQPAAEPAAETSEPAAQEVQQAVHAAAAAPAPKPLKPVKPMKVQKPNRRKPQPKPQQDSAIHPTNKLPSLMPLRKVPNVVPSRPVSAPAEVVAVHEVEDEVKPVPPRYKKRPAVSYNSEKEVVEVPAQPFRIEFLHTLSNPESYKRKRPTYAHKNKVVVTKVAEEQPAAVQPAPEVVEAAEPVLPAIKFESNLAAIPAPAEKEETIAAVEHVAEQVAVELPIADAEPQASETGEVAVEPEQTLKTIAVQPILPEVETTQVGDVPAEVAQSVAEVQGESVAPIVDEAINVGELAAEEVPKVEEPQTQEVANVEESVAAVAEAAPEVAPAKEIRDEEPAAAVFEAIEETPAVIVEEVAQTAPVEEKQQEETANIAQPTQFEAHAQTEQSAEMLADQLVSASEPVALETEHESVAPVEIAEESLPALPSLEELEEQKPVDAVEMMSATAEMEQQAPIVEQAFADKDAHLQTVGGFKPVDPELAAEAEALISDFISTLRSDNLNGQPMLPVPVEEETPSASAESEDSKVEIGATQENEEKIVEAAAKPEEEAPIATEAEATQLKTVAAQEPATAEAESAPIVVENEPIAEEEVKVSPMLKFPISNSFPADMYQIPVTVIQTPYEEVKQAETAMQVPQQIADENVKTEAVQVQKEAEVPAAEESQQPVKFLPTEPAAEITEEQKGESLPVGEVAPEAQPVIVESLDTAPEAAQTAQVDSAPEAQPVVAEAAESKPEIAQSAAPVAFRPISIDDIVELVKERLDQAPANEKGAPMELVVDSSNADKPVELKFSLNKGSAPQEVSDALTPAEDIIFPIYHRVSEPESSDVKAQEVIDEEEPKASVTELKKLPAEETEAVQEVVQPPVQTVDQAVQTDNAELEANTAVKNTLNTETETEAEVASAPAVNVQETDATAPELAGVETVATAAEESAKTNRALRSRSLTKANLDPRKRRFLFRSDAS